MKTETQEGFTATGEKFAVEVPKLGRPGCGNCAFVVVSFDATNQLSTFECRRYAPKPGSIAVWPTVRAEDWCGMYTSRKEFLEGERMRREAMGVVRLLGDLADPGKAPPESLNG